MIAMIDIVRRHEYLMLKGIRTNIGKFVKTTTQSCQLHDSNLINVELSRRLRKFDVTEPDPFAGLPALTTIRGNKATESFSYNAVRFVGGAFKKNKDWKAFLLDTYGDTGGIKPIKSARFWSAMLVGGYLYKRVDFLDEFMQGKDHSKLQVGGSLQEVIERKELFRWETLMMSVDYRGFHSPWNKKASAAGRGVGQPEANTSQAAADTWSLEEQCAYVKSEVEKHKQCIAIAQKRNAYWLEHARPIILDRDLYLWKCRYFKENKRQPGTEEISAKQTDLAAGWDDTQAAVPVKCIRRQKAMHEAIVVKCEQLLENMVATGEAPAEAQRAGAVVTNFPVEDIFQYMRQLHDRCSVTRVGYLQAMRRVRKAPSRGGSPEARKPFTLREPPPWYAPWLRESLRQRARDTIRKEWPSAAQRAAQRWAKTQEVSEVARVNRQRIDGDTEEREEGVLERQGGRVGSGEEADLLAPGALLDLEGFASIDFKNEASWTVLCIANQLKLRNMRKEQRSATLTRLLEEAEAEEREKSQAAGYAPVKFFGRQESLCITGKKEVLIARVERVLQIEERAVALEEEGKRLAAADEAKAARNSRRSRVIVLPSHLRA
jgi:hypothetical protein